MDKIYNKELYKYKAQKYYRQYLDIKQKSKYNKLIGGSIIKPDWYDDYLKEINTIYDDSLVITGSGAVSIYLNYFNNLTNGKFNELIPNLRIPNDADFLYCCKGSDYESRRNIKKYSRQQDSPQRSVTYEFNGLGTFPTYIKTYDLTCLIKINYVNIDKYKLLSLEKLLDFYSQELEDSEMFLRSAHDDALEFKKKIDKSKKESSHQLLDLEEEYGEKLNKSEQINNKILALNLKINIINTLIDNIKIDSELTSSYNIQHLPIVAEASKKRDEDEGEEDGKTKTSKKDSTKKSFIYRLFGDDDSDDEDKLSSSEKMPKKLDFDDSPSDKFKPMLPLISNKLDFGDDSDVPTSPVSPLISRKLDFDSFSSSNRVRDVPYNIKFDFEKDD